MASTRKENHERKKQKLKTKTPKQNKTLQVKFISVLKCTVMIKLG